MALAADNSSFNLQPFKIDLTGGIPRSNALANNTRLPETALYPDVGQNKGIEVDFLRELRNDWVESFDWETQQTELNQFASTLSFLSFIVLDMPQIRFDQYTAVIEGQTVHFVHEKSEEPDASPLILLHGWPGSFQEFAPVIKPLAQTGWGTSNNNFGKNVSYHVVVPSLPGFVFSSAPPVNWTITDTARIFNTLMTEVLGYPTYAVHGTDWVVGYLLYSSFNTTVRAAHFVFIPFTPPTAQGIAANNITLSAVQNVTEHRDVAWLGPGFSYFTEATTKPNDIGLALYDSPVGQLAWIAGKLKLWSDPRAGTAPSVLNSTAILTSVSLYYLTDSFLSSTWIYAQNPNVFNPVYSKAQTDAPMFFSLFEYTIALWPQEYVAQVGNLVSYNVHDFGGHFAGLDNPPALIEDIREMGLYFEA
ncbi:Alpha/Beta hydrolase protein [Mycena maculata]|uniref:Alpha/Beta hydrolase protein n=1 Tax=Mycena maculata TaxID=230809 RepID=A0AAD7NQ42_9AGAR|nr:Alpha/Beta hydrolase protein [Mycena maculata]